MTVTKPNPAPPALPAKRGRRLSIDDGGSSNGDLFCLFPYGIRREILVMAFGNRTIHIHLRLPHPPIEQQRPARHPHPLDCRDETKPRQ